ncbi:MAG: rhomboid family intramembrane serine protease [Bacteroidota bacterium]
MDAQEKAHFRWSIRPALYFILLIWIIKFIEVGIESDFGVYGTYPRTIHGSIGVITGPLIHGDFQHLLSNSFPILFLGIGVFYFYRSVAWQIVSIIYLLSGFWVWLVARDAYHIGASGLAYGMMAYLLFSGLIRRDRSSIAVSMTILVLHGGSIFTGVLPGDPGVSWESHLLGAIAGLFCAVLYRKSHMYHMVGSEIEQQTMENKTDIDYNYDYVDKSKVVQTTKYYTYKVDFDETSTKDHPPK